MTQTTATPKTQRIVWLLLPALLAGLFLWGSVHMATAETTLPASEAQRQGEVVQAEGASLVTVVEESVAMASAEAAVEEEAESATAEMVAEEVEDVMGEGRAVIPPQKSLLMPTTSGSYEDLSTTAGWDRYGYHRTGESVWSPSGTGNVTIDQETNNNHPSFYVSPDEYENVVFQGLIELGGSDEDYIGLVFGYQSPTSTTSTDDYDFVLFDWKKEAEVGSDIVCSGHSPTYPSIEGFTLMTIQATGPSNPTGNTCGGIWTATNRWYWERFWEHDNSDVNILASDYGTDRGWVNGGVYTFTVFYFQNQIQIYIDGSGFENEKIFDVHGDFPKGRLGFYTFSQIVSFGNITITPLDAILDRMTWPSDDECPVCTTSQVKWFSWESIDTQNGNMSYQETDMDIPIRGGSLGFRRSYASQSTGFYTTTVGYGWTHNYDMRLHFTNNYFTDSIEFQGAGGSRVPFRIERNGNNQITDYVPYSGVTADLITTTTGYQLTGFNQMVFDFNTDGQLVSQTDASGNIITFTYNVTGLLTSAQQDERSLSYTYNTDDRLIAVEDHAGRITGLAYDGSGNLTTVTNTLDYTTTYDYGTGTHNLTKITDPTGRVLQETFYDSQGRAYLQKDGDGNELVRIDFTLTDTHVITENGVVMTHTYDIRNALSNVEYACADGTTGCQQGPDMTYDANFKPASTIDANGHPTYLEWDEGGSNLEQIIDALAHTTTMQYDTFNNLIQIVNARGYTTTYGYKNSTHPTFQTAMTDTLGHVTLYTPTTEGWLQTQEGPNGTVTAYTYDNYGQLTQLVVATDTIDALTTTYSYDNVGRLVTMTQTSPDESHTSLNVYDNGNRLVATIVNWTGSNTANWRTDCDTSSSIRDENICTQYGYDRAGRLISTTNTLGQTDLTFYDDAGRPVTDVINYDGTTAFNSLCTDYSDPDPEYNLCALSEYDEADRLITTTDSIGRLNRTDYDPMGRVARTIINLQHVPTDTYPFSCDVRTIHDSAVDEDICTLFEYDAVGNTILVTDTAGRMSRTFYDELNRVKARVTNWTNDIGTPADCEFPPAQPDTNLCTVFEYDEVGNTIVVTNSLGQRTRTFYDELNRVEAIVENWQGTLTDPANCNLATNNTDEEDVCTLHGYDEVGNLITTTNALNQTFLTIYDNLSRPTILVQNWDETTTIEDLGDCSFPPTEVDTNLCTATKYDSLGRRTVVTDTMGNVTGFTYDNLGRLVDTNRYYSFLIRNQGTATYYDALGNLIHYIDNIYYEDGFPYWEGNTTVFTYDSLNRLRTTTSPEGVVMTQTYDAASRVVTITDGLDHSTDTTYDGLDRVVATIDPLGNTTTYEYDIFGNQVVVTDALGIRTAYDYDNLNRLISVIENEDPLTNTTTAELNVLTIYEYDALGNQLVITNALGYTHTTTLYDDLNRPVLITNGLGYTSTIDYDAVGNRLTVVDANGLTTTYGYDGVNRVTDMTYLGDGEVVSYTYDAMGNRLFMTDSVGTTQYGYDDLHRLTYVEDPYGEIIKYVYDIEDLGSVFFSQATKWSNPYDGRHHAQFWDKDHRLISVREIDFRGAFDDRSNYYQYDEVGRLVTSTLYLNDALYMESYYIYDAANRLIELQHTDGYGGLYAQYEYELDAMGNRVAVTETHLLPFDTGATAFLPTGTTSEEILADAQKTVEEFKPASGKPLASPASRPETQALINPLAYTSLLGPGVADLELQVSKQHLTADGVDFATFTVIATTQLGTPVPDGTPIYLEGEGIHLPQWALTTVDGQVSGIFISGEQAGLAHLTAWAEGSQDSLSLTLLPPETPLIDQPVQERPALPFDSQAVVEASRNQIDTSDETPILRRPDHTATFVADGLQFIPQVAGNSDTFAVTLASIHMGNSALRLNISPVHPTIEGHVARLERGNQVVEEFVARDAGIEQRWWLANAPRNGGDLRLTVAIDTPFLLSEENQGNGLLFTLLNGTPAVHYGQATAIDALGHSKWAQMTLASQRWDEENRQWHYEVTIRLPADWLAEATFPLLIDPLIGNPHYASEGDSDQAQPAIAYNSTNDEYMVVWQDSRDGTSQIYGQIVNNTHYDPVSNFTITLDAYTHTLPAIAYNAEANEYLVVWEKNETDILGQRLDETGKLVDDPMTLATTDASDPAVAYSAVTDRWLVTWAQEVSSITAIRARSVYTDNSLGTTFVISNSTGAAYPAVVADGEGWYLIAWQQTVSRTNDTADIAARRVTTATADGDLVMMTLTRTQESPALTFNSDRNEYFLVWQTTNDANGYQTIYGRQGALVDSLWVSDTVRISGIDGPDASVPAVTYTADDQYLVAWTELGSGGQTEIMAQQVLSTAITSGDVISILIEAENQLDVAVASGSTEVMLAWTDNRHPTEDVYARFWQLDGEMFSNFRLHPAAGDQYNPAVAYNPYTDEYLVVWTQVITASNSDIYAQRVSNAGNLVGGNITITHSSTQEERPAVAVGKDTYLVVWRSYGEISAQFVQGNGILMGDVITDIDALENESATNPAVAYNSQLEKFLVVWNGRNTGYTNNNIWGRYIHDDIKESRFAITTDNTTHQFEPKVAYNGDDNEFLVVWTNVTASGSDIDIYGRRVLSDGTVITSSNMIMVDDELHYEQQPTVVYEPTSNHYLVVGISDPNDDGKYEIIGRVVSHTGVLVGSVITISDDTNNEVQPTIALDGHGNAMVVWRRWQGSSTPDKTMYDLFGSRLTGEGGLLDETFTVLSVGQDQVQPALAGNGDENYLLTWQDQRSGDKDVYVSSFQALQAQFVTSPTVGVPNEAMTFIDTSLPAGVVDTWLWDFGTTTSSSQTPTHTYTDLGVYTVTLTVTDNDTGETDTFTRFVLVGQFTTTQITYEYDPLYRLTKATYTGANEATYEYVYDAVGNMTTYTDTIGIDVTRVNRTFNRGNQLVTATDVDEGTSSFSYDHNGNLIQIIPPMETYTYTLYGYNQRNLMITSTYVVDSVPNLQVEFIYDGDGNRLRQIDHTTNVTTTYTNDIGRGLTQVLMADDGTDTVINLIGLDLVLQYSSSEDRVLLTDGLGSVRLEVVDAAVETVTTYEPFGGLLSQTGSSGTVYGFTGEQSDSVTGMLYLRKRYYNPTHRVFMSVDPHPGILGIPTSQHPYSYVYNNPVNLTDPNGDCPICLLAGVFYIGEVGRQTYNNMQQNGLGWMGFFDAIYYKNHDQAQILKAIKNGALLPLELVPGLDGALDGFLEQLITNIADPCRGLFQDITQEVLRGAKYDLLFLGAGTLLKKGGGALKHLGGSKLDNLLSSLGQTGRRHLSNVADVVERNVRRAGDRLDNLLGRRLDDVYRFCSFSADTLVSTEDGLVPISELELGDLVLGFNEFSGDVGYYPITAVWEHVDPMLVYLIIDGEVIITTPEHPFYTADGEWVPAGALFTGDTIRTSEWSTGTVELVVFVKQSQVMYNLTVGTAHTFFVGDGQWLVHNHCGEWETVNEAMSQAAEDYQVRITGRSIDQAYVINDVKFDGFSNGVLLDAKGPNYARFVKNDRFTIWFRGAKKLVEQAERQIEVVGGRHPIEWHVAEKSAVNAIKALFAQEGITEITVKYVP